jgi:beta-glucosidase-like glycosyl hydrolase
VLAVNAGNDVLLFRSNLRNGNSISKQVIDIIEQKVNAGIIPQYRIEESYARIIYLKTKYGIITDINELSSTQTPLSFQLYQNYPNPFNPSTKIRYSVPFVETHRYASPQNVSLKVYDVLGNEIATLVNEQKAPGNYSVEFDGSKYSSGIYFYRLQSGSFTATKKLILVK